MIVGCCSASRFCIPMASDMDDGRVEPSNYPGEGAELSNTPSRAEDATLEPEDIQPDTPMPVLENPDDPGPTQPTMGGPVPKRKLEPDFLQAAKDMNLLVNETTTEQVLAVSRPLANLRREHLAVWRRSRPWRERCGPTFRCQTLWGRPS